MPLSDDARRRLRALPPDRRRAIARAVRRGEAVRDPRDASLAVEVAASTERLRRFAGWLRRPWLRVIHALGIVSGVVWLVRGDWLVGGLLIVSWLYLLQMAFLFRWLADRARIAEAKNRALAGTSAPPET